MQETRPVLIVGAGPTGMTAALELARFGIPLRIIDKYKQPPDTSRALAVQARTVELMQQRGLAAEMLALGNRGRSTVLYGSNKTLGTIDLSQIDSRFNFILLLAQSETERILREHLASLGITVERETELVAFSQAEHDTGVQGTLRKPGGSLEELQAAYLIDAEGAHSTVRRSMDLPFEGKSLPNTYALADLHLSGDLAEDQLSIFLAETGLLAAFPLGNSRFRIIATEKQPPALEAAEPDLAHMQALWQRASHIPVRLHDMVWSSRFRINSRALAQLRHGRVFFGGDSAHIHSPAGGQGMNTGIQDMINLGWKLALVYRGLAPDSLLDTYDEERMPIIRDLVSTTERATDLFNSDNHLVHLLVDHALPVALGFAAIQRRGATIVSELGGNYRKSSLASSAASGGTIRPGDRFPDVVLAADDPARALDRLDPSAFTIFSTDEAAATILSPALFPAGHRTLHTLAHPSGDLLAVLGRATTAVVRPDGYLLAAGSVQEVQSALEQWAGRWVLQA